MTTARPSRPAASRNRFFAHHEVPAHAEANHPSAPLPAHLPRAGLLLRRAIATAVALVGVAGSVRADVKTAEYTSDQEFAFELTHMPDLDQIRSGSEGLFEDGVKFAIPTCAIDMAAYIAWHGFPDLGTQAHPPSHWQADTSATGWLYDYASLKISLLGTPMGATINVDGPASHAWGVFMADNLDGDMFTLTELYGVDNTHGPSLADAAKQALMGGLVAVQYGRYHKSNTQIGVPLVTLDGTHTVVMTRANASAGSQSMRARDPMSADGTLTQSAFANKVYGVITVPVLTSASLSSLKVMTGLDLSANASEWALINRLSVIRPKAGYAFSNGMVKVIAIHVPFQIGGAQQSKLKSIVAPAQFQNIFDVELSVDGTAVYALVDADQGDGVLQRALYCQSLLGGNWQKIVALPQAENIVFSRQRQLFAVGGQHLYQVAPSAAEAIVGGELLPAVGADVFYDDATDEVVVLSVAANRLYRYNRDLKLNANLLLPAIPLAGDGSVIVNPFDKQVWIAGGKDPALFGVEFPTSGDPHVTVLPMPDGKVPTDVDVDDAGHLFAACQGRVYEFAPTGNGYQLLTGSPWSEVVSDGAFRITRSRSDFDPALHSGPAWHAMKPDEQKGLVADVSIPDCDTAANDVEYGMGHAGTNGVPALHGSSLPVLGTVTGIEVKNARPGALPILLLGVQSTSLPFSGGTLLVVPALSVPLPQVASDGHVSIEATLPTSSALCGITVYHQVLIPDAGAAGFYHVALTNGLARTFGS